MATCGEVKPLPLPLPLKEGINLLGSPSYVQLDNGRFKCVETGHELLAKDKESYSNCKRCRLGLIDFALSTNKPPLNMFNQSPLSSWKLICKLTGDIVNKSEEHIWKHINGKRFLNKLELKENEKLSSNGQVDIEPYQEMKAVVDAGNRNKNKKKMIVEELVSQIREPSNQSDESEAEFWIPPVGERWDFDDGKEDRWGSGSEADDQEHEADENEDGGKESEELSLRTKRMSIEIGPSSFASRKKKAKKKSC